MDATSIRSYKDYRGKYRNDFNVKATKLISENTNVVASNKN